MRHASVISLSWGSGRARSKLGAFLSDGGIRVVAIHGHT